MQTSAPEDTSAEPERTTTTNGHTPVNGHTEDDKAPEEDADSESAEPEPSLTAAKLEAMSQEREALRVEVEQLRRQLETIQSAHNEETSQLRSDLEESEAAKDRAENQYQTLLTRVEKIKETLGDRLKRDRAELEEAKDRIEELEALNEQSQTDQRNVQEQFARLKEEMAEQEEELTLLRSRSNLSQQNWLKEKEGLELQNKHLKAELESATNAMGEWEVIAMEERSMRENLAEKVADLEEQLVSVREAYQRAAQERDTQSSAIDGLQRALQEIQEARRKELREMVESSEEQLSALRKQAKEAEARALAAESERENLAKELERTVPFEKEVKEKNLLIGKLRHEAIVLNDHLTKALKYIKKTKPEETIDRYVSLPTLYSSFTNNALTRPQANRDKPLPPLLDLGSFRPAQVPDPPGHSRPLRMDRRATRTSRSRTTGRIVEHVEVTTHVALPQNAQFTRPEHGILL